MKGIVQQWGNSLAIRIPRHLAAESQVQKGSSVELSVVKGKLVVTPREGPGQIRLAELLRGMTPRNRHREQAIGRGVGAESW